MLLKIWQSVRWRMPKLQHWAEALNFNPSAGLCPSARLTVAIHRFSAGLRQDTVGVLIRREMRYQEQGCEEGQPVLLDGQVCIASWVILFHRFSIKHPSLISKKLQVLCKRPPLWVSMNISPTPNPLKISKMTTAMNIYQYILHRLYHYLLKDSLHFRRKKFPSLTLGESHSL